MLLEGAKTDKAVATRAGASASAERIAEEWGFTAEKVAARIKEWAG